MLFTSVRNPPSPALWRGHSRHHSPSTLLLQLGAEEQVSEQEDVTQLAGALHQLHHEAVLQQLPVLWARCGQGASQGDECGGRGDTGPSVLSRSKETTWKSLWGSSLAVY